MQSHKVLLICLSYSAAVLFIDLFIGKRHSHCVCELKLVPPSFLLEPFGSFHAKGLLSLQFHQRFSMDGFRNQV